MMQIYIWYQSKSMIYQLKKLKEKKIEMEYINSYAKQ